MAKWGEIQAQAKKLIDEGMSVLKSGFSDAEFLAETTASAARLHMDAGRRRFEMYRVLHDLGAVLYNAATAATALERIALTPAMRALIGNARALDDTIADDERQLGHISVVKGNSSLAPSDSGPKEKNPKGTRPKKRTTGARTAARRSAGKRRS